MTWRLISVLCLAVVGCVGSYDGGGPFGGGGGGGGEQPDAAVAAAEPDAAPVIPPTFSIVVDPPNADLVLGETATFTVTLTSEHEFAGPVTLSALGVPASWQTSFAPSDTITLMAGEVATATFDVMIPTDGDATMSTVTIGAEGGGGGGAAVEQESAAVAVQVSPELIMHIPVAALNDPANAFGGTVNVRYFAPGTRITWVNDDLVAHRIHADNVNGFDHEGDDMAAQGGSYSVVITQPGTYEYSCHIHSSMTGVLVITN